MLRYKGHTFRVTLVVFLRFIFHLLYAYQVQFLLSINMFPSSLLCLCFFFSVACLFPPLVPPASDSRTRSEWNSQTLGRYSPFDQKESAEFLTPTFVRGKKPRRSQYRTLHPEIYESPVQTGGEGAGHNEVKQFLTTLKSSCSLTTR